MKNNNFKNRQETLKNAGINTTKHFQVTINEDIPKGSVLSISIDKDDFEAEISSLPHCFQDTAQEIFESGYVKNTKLYRRWIMAQTMRMLEHDGGWSKALHNYNYKYTLDMMLEEVRVLSILEKDDKEAFEERSQFFTRDVIMKVLKDHEDKITKYVKKTYFKNRLNETVTIYPYGMFLSFNAFEVYQRRMLQNLYLMLNREASYMSIYAALSNYMKADKIRLPKDTSKSSAWIDAYKKAGAYYTLQNLIKFHGCVIKNYHDIKGNLRKVGKANFNMYYSLMILDDLLMGEYEGWRFHALLKKVIEDNNFDFHARMKEIYLENR